MRQPTEPPTTHPEEAADAAFFVATERAAIALQPYAERERIPYKKQGGIAWFRPLSDAEVALAFAASTPLGRRVLLAVAKGMEAHDIAAELGCSVGTIDRYRISSELWRDCWYHLQSLGRMPASPETLRQLAASDQMEHYEVLHSLAVDVAVAPRDRSAAAKEALVLAGAYKATIPTDFDFEYELLRMRGRLRRDE
jgi:hypothetical protein